MTLPNIFGANIAQIINTALGPLVFDQTLIKVTSIRDPSDSTKRIQTKVQHACKGFVDDFKDAYVNGTTVKITDRKIIILGASLPDGIVPTAEDEIIAEGITFKIVANGVLRDPAGATFECQAN